MKLRILIILSVFFIISCLGNSNKKTVIKASVIYESTFEGGYVYYFNIIETLEGDSSNLIIDDKGAIVSPPYIKDKKNNDLGLVTVEPKNFIITLIDTGKDLDEVKLDNPKPGSGAGEFFPLGVIDKRQKYWKIISFKLAE